MALLGTPTAIEGTLNEQDLIAMQRIAEVLRAGFPLVALLQLIRVYAQSIRKIAEAEVRLFHLYVHEPLIRQGVDALQMAEEMEGLARDLLPATSPLMEYIHQRYLRFYIEQDVVGHMEAELGGQRQLGRVQMAFCFVDLTGFTRYTEEEGDEEAFDLVERFVETVEATLPAEATIVKTIGDEVMIVSPDPVTLTEWAVGFLTLFQERPQPRVGVHYGRAVYRDGDYFGTEVNLTHRVVARALGGEVMVTTAVVDGIGRSDYLEFDPIGEVDLKGFPQPVELFVARPRGVRRDSPAGPPATEDSAAASRKIARMGPVGTDDALGALAEVVRRSGLIDPISTGVVLVSGGADSACAAAGLAHAIGPASVHALHVNYGLRSSADGDERVCRDLCSRLRIDLHIERPKGLERKPPGRGPRGPLRGRRAAPRANGRRLDRDRTHPDRPRGDGAVPACRLARERERSAACRRTAGASCGRCWSSERAETRRLAAEACLPFADDESNLEPDFARNRVRAEVLPVLNELSPAAERNIAETQAELVEEAHLLERVVLEALEAAGAGAGAVAIRADGAGGLGARPAPPRPAGARGARHRTGRPAWTAALGRDHALGGSSGGGRGRPGARACGRSASTG